MAMKTLLSKEATLITINAAIEFYKQKLDISERNKDPINYRREILYKLQVLKNIKYEIVELGCNNFNIEITKNG